MDVEEIRELLGNDFAFVYNETNPVIQDLNLDKTAKILDIGTGIGLILITLALNNFTIITGEPEDDQSKYAKKDWLQFAKKAKVDHMITYTPFNAEKMPFEDSSFDAIFIFGALHHIDDKKAALKECNRTVKINGIICIFEPNSKMLKFVREQKDPDHPDAVDPRGYAQDLHLSVELVQRPFYDTFILKKI